MHHHKTKNHHKHTCNRATSRSFSVKNSCSNEKRQIPGHSAVKTNSAVEFGGSNSEVKNPNSAARLEIPRPRKTVGPNYYSFLVIRDSPQRDRPYLSTLCLLLKSLSKLLLSLFTYAGNLFS